MLRAVCIPCRKPNQDQLKNQDQDCRGSPEKMCDTLSAEEIERSRHQLEFQPNQISSLMEEKESLRKDVTSLMQEKERIKKDHAELLEKYKCMQEQMKRLEQSACIRSECTSAKEELKQLKCSPCERSDCKDHLQQLKRNLDRANTEKKRIVETTKRDRWITEVGNMKAQMEKMQGSQSTCVKEIKCLKSAVGAFTDVENQTTVMYPIGDVLKEMWRKDQKDRRYLEEIHTAVCNQQCRSASCWEEKQQLKAQLERLQQMMKTQGTRQECIPASGSQGRRHVVRNTSRDMKVQTEANHDSLLGEFDELMTNPGEVKAVLEQHFDPCSSNMLLTSIFQVAYNVSRCEILKVVREILSSVFEVLPEKCLKTKEREMDDISRAFGLLLHASGVKAERSELIGYVKKEVHEKLKSNSNFKKVSESLDFDKVVDLALRFTLLPRPLIVAQPQHFNRSTHDQQYGKWDKTLFSTKNYELEYYHPVVYRAYDGYVARKGIVGTKVRTSTADGTSTDSGEQQTLPWWKRLFQ